MVMVVFLLFFWDLDHVLSNCPATSYTSVLMVQVYNVVLIMFG